MPNENSTPSKTHSIDDYLANPESHYTAKSTARYEELVDLSLVIPKEQSGEYPVICHLLFGELDIDLEKSSYQFSVSAATLCLELDGWEANLTDRLSSEGKPQDVSWKVTSGKEDGREAKLKGKDMEIGLNTKETDQSEVTSKYAKTEITPFTKNRWKIQSRSGDRLFGNVIPNTILCKIRPNGTANFKQLKATLYVKPVDFEIARSKNSKKLKHAKLVKALAIKRMRESGSAYPQVKNRLTNVTIEQIIISDEQD